MIGHPRISVKALITRVFNQGVAKLGFGTRRFVMIGLLEFSHLLAQPTATLAKPLLHPQPANEVQTNNKGTKGYQQNDKECFDTVPVETPQLCFKPSPPNIRRL